MVSVVGISPVGAGLIVSYVAGVIGCAYLFRLAEEQLGSGTGRCVALFLLLAPTAVFLTAPYSESLFLAGAIAAFYYARRDEWIASGISAAVAMGARAAALFLVLGLVIEFMTQPGPLGRRLGKAMVGLGIALLPLVAYCVYLAVVKNDAFDFLAAQRAGWYRTFVGPIRSFSATWGTWNDSQPTNWIFAWRLEILAAFAGVGFTIWAVVKRWWGYAAYMAATLIYLMTSTWYFSIPRLMLGLFPIFLLLGDWARSPARRELLIAVMGPVAALGVIVFTQGAWFF
jgi:Gpi18-like mannosyltransferase